MSTLSTRQTIGLVALFALTSIAFITLDNRSTLDPLKTALTDLAAPVTDLFNRIGDEDDSALAQQVQQLTQERDAARAENVRLKADLKDTEQLRAILGVQQSHADWTMQTARVLGVDPTGYNKYIVIDKGSLDGIKEGMAVVDPNYFVGLVVAPVEEHSARVMLAIDASAVIGAQLLDSGADGIVYGRWQMGGRLEMQYVDRLVAPKKNEYVVTSQSVDSRTAGVPGNLIIGVVEEEPETFNQGDSQTIKILPLCNFDNLTLVSVIVDDGDNGEATP